MPSDRFKHAFKVALAMAVTYAIALAMGWEKPFWAGLSVAFCSLATSGESIDRGIQRIVGTVFAGVVVLTLMSLFPQDRWLFLSSMSLFIAICTYLWTSGSRNNFIWFNAGFNFPILALLGGGLSLNSFEIVVLRAQETTLGVVVYSLVAVLVWPHRGGAGFRQSVASVCDGQRSLIGRYIRSMIGMPEDGDETGLRAKLSAQLMRLTGQLQGATYDSVEIWEARHAWRRCLREISTLDSALNSLHSAIQRRKTMNVDRFLPGLQAFGAEIDRRLSGINAMLTGQRPARPPHAAELNVDRNAMYTVTNAQRGTVLLCREQLLQIDSLTRTLFDLVSEIHGFRRETSSENREDRVASIPVLDHDRLAVTARQASVLWLTLLAVIYVPAFPNVVGTIALANAFAMALSIAPFVQARVFLVPSFLGAVFAGGLYMFVMPHLSGFGELGLMIFAATFAISYFYYAPQRAAARTMGLAMLLIVIGVENEQSYNFLHFANWLMAAVFFVTAMLIGWRFPISFRPEDRILAMLRRYFRSVGFLLSDATGEAGPGASWVSKWLHARHLHDVSVLPRRLQSWAATLPPQALGSASKAEFQALLAGLQAVTDRIRTLTTAEPVFHSGALPPPLLDELRIWRASLREAISRLCAGPDSEDLTAFRTRLQDTLEGVEARVDQVLDVEDLSTPSDQESKEIYRLLGACRGVSGALVDVIDRAAPIDWPALRESRF